MEESHARVDKDVRKWWCEVFCPTNSDLEHLNSMLRYTLEATVAPESSSESGKVETVYCVFCCLGALDVTTCSRQRFRGPAGAARLSEFGPAILIASRPSINGPGTKKV